MRICPNCGAENDDNALTCILCELEFDDIIEADSEPAPAEEYDAPFEGAESESVADTVDYAELVNEKPTAAPMNSAASDFERASSSGGKGKILAIAAAAIMIIAGGIGVGALLKNNSSSDSDTSFDSNAINTESSQTIDLSSSVAEISTVTKSSGTVANKTETTAAEKTVTTNTETSISITASNEEIETAKNNIVTAFNNNTPNVTSFNVVADYDINGDRFPELIISYMGISGDTNYYIYYYDGSQFVELKNCWGGLEVSETNHLILEKNYGGGEVSRYYELSNDYKLNKIDEISTFPGQNGYDYYRNGQQITSSEYYAALNYYKDMNWHSISSNSTNVVDSGNSNGSESGSSAPSMYSGYANIENAPSDMEFYDNSNITSIPTGTIQTQSTGLNLRKGPGTSYDVIMEIPKGEMVYVYGRNSEWCYVGYSSGVGMFNHTDYGYVSKDYLKISVG